MKKHESKFGEQPEHWKVFGNFIRKGKIGEGRSQFSTEQLKQYDRLLKANEHIDTPIQRYFKKK